MYRNAASIITVQFRKVTKHLDVNKILWNKHSVTNAVLLTWYIP